MASDVLEYVREHALRVARDKGWIVQVSDCIVSQIESPLGPHGGQQVMYWEAKMRIRAALNKHRALAKDGHISGMVRISGDTLLDTLAESPDILSARLHADGQQ